MTTKQLLAAGVVGFLATAGIALAQASDQPNQSLPLNDNATSTSYASQQVLTVDATGKILLRGTLVSVASSTLTVKGWGGNWTVNVPSSASTTPAGGALTSMHPGDFVGVQGTVDANASWTVNATAVNDWTENAQAKANEQAAWSARPGNAHVLQGTVSALNSATKTFTLTDASSTAHTVAIANGAGLYTDAWLTLDWSKVANGDIARVYGKTSSTTIMASFFRDLSVH